MQRWLLLFAAALMLAALPDTAVAQSSEGWWDWIGRTERDARTERTTPRTERRTSERRTSRDDDRRAPRTDRRDRDDDRDDRYDDRRRDRDVKPNAPPFCRSGQGHPTKGMAWCYDKGYVNGRYDTRRDRRYDDRWERRSIEDIVFGTPRDRDRRSRTVSGSSLDDILGRRVSSDLASVASGAITGRWVYPDGDARVLQLRDTRGPLAELTDFDGDGRVDLVLVNRDR